MFSLFKRSVMAISLLLLFSSCSSDSDTVVGADNAVVLSDVNISTRVVYDSNITVQLKASDRDGMQMVSLELRDSNGQLIADSIDYPTADQKSVDVNKNFSPMSTGEYNLSVTAQGFIDGSGDNSTLFEVYAISVVINSAPQWIDLSYTRIKVNDDGNGAINCDGYSTDEECYRSYFDTSGVFIVDDTDAPKEIRNLDNAATDIDGDKITFSITGYKIDSLRSSASDNTDESQWLLSFYIEDNILKAKNLMTNDPNYEGLIIVFIKADDGMDSSDANVTFLFHDVQ